MKKIVLTVLAVLGGITIQSQTILNDNVTLKKGFFKSLEEFQQNNPSIEFDHLMKSKVKKLAFKSKFTYYKLRIDRQETKKIGKVFAVFDGKNLYINRRNTKSPRKAKFSKIDSLDNSFYYYQDIDYVFSAARRRQWERGASITGFGRAHKKTHSFDATTGEIRVVNN